MGGREPFMGFCSAGGVGYLDSAWEMLRSRIFKGCEVRWCGLCFLGVYFLVFVIQLNAARRPMAVAPPLPKQRRRAFTK